jgi:hypothetical protein
LCVQQLTVTLQQLAIQSEAVHTAVQQEAAEGVMLNKVCREHCFTHPAAHTDTLRKVHYHRRH